ncbi:hypothetical protein QEN19_001994 [Hanseniaspora menglaensis]
MAVSQVIPQLGHLRKNYKIPKKSPNRDQPSNHLLANQDSALMSNRSFDKFCDETLDDSQILEKEEDFLLQETALINQLIKDQYAKKGSGNATKGSSELDHLLYKNSISKFFHILSTQSYQINFQQSLSVSYDSFLKVGTINGKNIGGFIKANNGKSLTTDLHKINPFEILYNLERLTPIIVYNNDKELVSIENFYNEVASSHLDSYKLYSHFKRLGYLISFDWWGKEYSSEKNVLESTFYSLISPSSTQQSILDIIIHYYYNLKYRVIKTLQRFTIQSALQLQKYLSVEFEISRNLLPKTIQELHMMHSKTKNSPTLANIYKSTISKTQTVKHPHLPDYQLISTDCIPEISKVPFSQLDYKFTYLLNESNEKQEGKISNFDEHTFVQYFDSKQGVLKEVNRSEFLAKKNKNKIESLKQNVYKNEKKKLKRYKTLDLGRSVVCSLNGFEDVFLELVEVDLL